jgi:hypothetical protein
MREEFNIYCDESCHLEHDNQKAMVLGAVWCPKGLTQEVFERLRNLKAKHGLSHDFEIKWNKVSPAKVDFYKDVIDFYFDDDDLCFRALVVPDKTLLDHQSHNQSHDDFYYKMYFDLLKVILDPQNSYNIYLDIKDTKSQQKVDKLKDVLRKSHYDYSHSIVRKIQQVHSHEVELIQLTDLLIGAISYVHRDLKSSPSKLQLIELIKSRSKYSLLNSTLIRESKMNLFIWKTKGEANNVK